MNIFVLKAVLLLCLLIYNNPDIKRILKCFNPYPAIYIRAAEFIYFNIKMYIEKKFITVLLPDTKQQRLILLDVHPVEF